jgi:hypothetical protein
VEFLGFVAVYSVVQTVSFSGLDLHYVSGFIGIRLFQGVDVV